MICKPMKVIDKTGYEEILSHGVLHLPYKNVRDRFIA